ncbi:MAG: DUF87 domain-containing protein [Rubrivivax sp.]|nr:DUF87 domain-containing protein [Rubrivivax sp.]
MRKTLEKAVAGGCGTGEARLLEGKPTTIALQGTEAVVAPAAPLCRHEQFAGSSDPFGAPPAGIHVRSFRLALQTVAAAAITPDERRLQHNEAIAAGDAARQRALSALLGTIGPGQRLAVVHAMERDELGRPCYRVGVEGTSAASSKASALALAGRLRAEVVTALAVGCPQYGFRAADDEHTGSGKRSRNHAIERAFAVRVVPAHLEVGAGANGQAGFMAVAGDHDRALLPMAPTAQQTFLDSVVAGLMAAPHEMELRIEWIGRALGPEQERTLAGLLDRLSNLDLARVRVVGAGVKPTLPSMQDLAAVHAWMRQWLARPVGVDMQVSVRSAGPLPETLLRPVAAEIMQGRAFSLCQGAQGTRIEDLDFSSYLPADGPLPPLLPSPASLGRLGLRRHFGEVRLRTPATGTLLGSIPTTFADEPVRLGAADRAQHCYVIGATGTGKSTLLLNMIGQDIEAGHGVALLDPHGDLHREVLARVPAERREDVVLMDFTDFDHPPGLNLLELKTQRPDLERNFIIQHLTKIQQRLYGSVPESMGPMFFMYQRNAVALTLADPHRCPTLLDVPRVFSDSAYRAYLLQNCTDESVREFWRGIAGPATGDSSLQSIAPYIVNKFTEFTQNALVRSVVGQPRTTVDLRAAMDQKKILLVNLSKGLLSELDTHFLGMLLTGQLFAAATSRADMPAASRTPFHVYIDEFQNFTNDSIGAMLAEARKYGVALTVAHQELGQVPRELRDSLLANTGSKVMFRVSCADAEALAQYIAPHYTPQDLMTLPDHTAMARIKIGNVPSPAFVMQTRLPADAPAAPLEPIGMAAPSAGGPEEPSNEAAQRGAFLPHLRFDDNLLEASTCRRLAAEGAQSLRELGAMGAALRDELIGKVDSLSDRRTLRALVRRIAADV